NQPLLSGKTEDRPLVESAADSIFPDIIESKLKKGRDRMPEKVVFFFFLIRAYLGNIKSEESYTFITESKFIELFLISEGIGKIPSASAILGHLNNLSENTLRLLHRITLKEALTAGIDDFKKLYFDSTRISADSTWPTESKTIVGLTSRIFHGFQVLGDYDIKINFPQGTKDKIDQIKKLALEIALISGKKNSKNNRKKLYRKIISLSKTLQKTFKQALARAVKKIGDILPSIKEAIEGLCEWCEVTFIT
ncbi:MAG: hypothetical protein D3913_14220, partial [Candidatus Electrothrix sp. LOE1_4_5]|nr:hypothetical protein [Candidatus Electrothrix gigas]